MDNILFKNQEVILSLNDYPIDGLGEKIAPLDILYDCFMKNAANFDNPTAPFYQCCKAREDVAYWQGVREQIEAAKGAGELADMREAFYLSFRK